MQKRMSDANVDTKMDVTLNTKLDAKRDSTLDIINDSKLDAILGVIHLNGTSPSKCQHSSCWHTKGHLWIEGFLKHYRWAYYELHLSSIQLVIFTF